MADYDLPDDLRYTAEDEWIRGDETRITVGITDFAQQQLGDIVFVELPPVGSTVVKGESFGVVESVKAVSDLFAPVSGEVAEVNSTLEEVPECVNEDCYGDGWILAITPSDPKEFESLLDAAAYATSVEERED